MALTALAIKNAKFALGAPGSKYAGEPVRVELPDNGSDGVKGLRLVVQPSGVKSWALRYRTPSGKPAKLTWPFDSYTLAQVRDAARAAKRTIAEGRDPKATAPVSTPVSEKSFEAVWERYYREWVLPGQTPTKWQSENAQAFETRLKLWHGRDVTSVTRQEVRSLLKSITASGSPYMANRVQSMLNRFFRWCAEEVELIPANIMLGLKSEKEEKRDRVLSMDELCLLWQASAKVDWPWGPIVRLLMLTGQRLSEITHVRWSEVDHKTCTLHLAGARTKNGHKHDVPLSLAAMSVLKSLPRIGDRDTVFVPHPAAKLSGTHGKQRVEAALAKPIEDWRFHDLRRSFVTHLNKLGVLPHVVEDAINHISGHKGGVAGVYNLAHYPKEVREAMEMWGKVVAQKVPAKNR